MTKYRNTPTHAHGKRFDSKKEARRYGDLLNLERSGQIERLECQPVYEIEIRGVKVCKVIPDFRYVENGSLVVEDVKSPATRKNSTYRLKKKLAEAMHGIEIREV